MKKNKITILVFFLCLSHYVFAQELPENATIIDITNAKDDISNRMKNIANNESEISEERRWASSLKKSVLRQKNYYSNSEKPTDIDKFKTDMSTLIDRICKLNCQNIQDCKYELESVLTEFEVLSRDENIIDIFNEPKEWMKVSNKFNQSYKYFNLGIRQQTTQFNEQECAKLKAIFSNKEIKDDLNNFIESRRKEIAKKIKETEDKIAALGLLEQEINNYNIKLNEAWQKANTKMSLQTNLYLMILVIGLLSIATIGIIRWFPDTVMKEWVESGQVIQFVTVMILLSVIMSLGLAGLLGENTLGTLLGGIGGYVLSQGVGRAAAKAALKDVSQNKSQ
ncbi:hypothetical protein ACLI1A_16400 [Flavobacterium sp. RHBU_3]|uniref:hypothetical protein n=1 Tax=Flavobacterium sp. RHBU_3 TaxID=3391184 RepID=UPI0039848ED8